MKLSMYEKHSQFLTSCFVLHLGLMGLLEKRRFRNFLMWANDYNMNDPKTFKGMCI